MPSEPHHWYQIVKRSQIDKILCGVKSWNDLTAKIELSNNTKDKGDIFERFTQIYLKLSPVYQTKLKDVWTFDEVPPSVAKALGLPRIDLGIDLIAETFDGKFWSIQSKYRENIKAAITYDELSTFVALTFGEICRKDAFSYGLICTTTEGISKHLHSHAKIGVCAVDEWGNLDASFFARMHQYVTHKPVKLQARKPKPHQVRAIKKGVKHFATSDRGKLISPCGSGKSLTAFWLAQALQSNLTLVAVPSLALIKQTLNVWLTETVATGTRPDWLIVCSDESAGKVKEADSIVADIYEMGVPCKDKSQAAEITKFLKQKTNVPRILFTTYQSSEVTAEASRKAKATFDFGVFDEAHKTVGHVDKTFPHFLSEKNIKIKKRLFMTATERVFRGNSDKIVSMDDATIYGGIIDDLSFKEAIAQGILCDYEIWAMHVTPTEIKDLISNNDYLNPDKGDLDDITAQKFAALIAMRKAYKQLGIKHTISFHSSIARAQDFQKLQEKCNKSLSKKLGNVHSYHVSGNMPMAKRDTEMRLFETVTPSLVTNARCLTEGVDVPDIDCVMFADAKNSIIDIVQAAGRAMRTAPGKTKGYIVIPVLLDDELELGSTDSRVFGQTFRVLRALASNDDRIVDELKAISQGVIPKTSIVKQVLPEILPTAISADQFINAVTLKFWDKLAKLNWRTFEEAREYIRSLNLKSQADWREYCRGGKKPADIPSAPDYNYKDRGWISWGDWFGTGRIADQNKIFRSFTEARKFAGSLQFRSGNEWQVYCRSGQKPVDIPSNPDKIYRDKGWTSMGDWLGTGIIHPKDKVFRPYPEAKKYVHELNLGFQKQWREYCQSGEKPADIPSNPNKIYKDKGWVSYGDWLGTGRIAAQVRVYRPYPEAKKYVHGLKLRSNIEWQEYCQSGKKPDDIPAYPNQTYKNDGWVNMGDWLGTGRIANQAKVYRQFRQARKFVHDLKLGGQKQWLEYCQSGKKPDDIPAYPNQTYKHDGWVNMGDWLGTGIIHPKDIVFRPYPEAKKYVHGLKLRSNIEWREYCRSGKKPDDIPAHADRSYKGKGWISWGNWLGTGQIANQVKVYRQFRQARKFVHELKLGSQQEWSQYCQSGKKPDDIPAYPNQTYKNDGWVNMGDWLGTGRIAEKDKVFRSFTEARKFARSLHFKSRTEWQVYCRSGQKPVDIPSNPDKIYKDKGWHSVGDWLGTGRIAD